LVDLLRFIETLDPNEDNIDADEIENAEDAC